jgi:hypothetical protein
MHRAWATNFIARAFPCDKIQQFQDLSHGNQRSYFLEPYPWHSPHPTR